MCRYAYANIDVMNTENNKSIDLFDTIPYIEGDAVGVIDRYELIREMARSASARICSYGGGRLRNNIS